MGRLKNAIVNAANDLAGGPGARDYRKQAPTQSDYREQCARDGHDYDSGGRCACGARR